MAGAAVLAIDQGSSGTKCALIGEDGRFVSRGAAALAASHPRPGWVEYDAHAIWTSVRDAVAGCLDGQDADRVVAVGLSTQRESLVAWDAASGEPLSPVVSWQDRRGAGVCDRLRSPANEELVRQRSGLPLDPMFSASKAAALLDAIDPDRHRARSGALRLGTIDSWLLSRFSGGHLTEAGNASRTQLLNVHAVDWDDDLLALFDVPRAALGRVVASVGSFPALRGLAPLRDGTPVTAVLGDSHAALFGHGAVKPGAMKATYGTGSSVMGVVEHPERVTGGTCLTIGWMTDRAVYAAEGNILATGAALRWLAGILGVDVDELAALGLAAPSSDGVAFVPAFGGLGAPWWDRDAVALFTNLTLGTTREAMARAALESVVQQVADVVEAMVPATGPVDTLFVDGGPTRVDGLVQLQADRLGCRIARAREPELSALGAAHLAGLSAGLWTEAQLAELPRPRDMFAPHTDLSQMTNNEAWRGALARSTGRIFREG